MAQTIDLNANGIASSETFGVPLLYFTLIDLGGYDISSAEEFGDLQTHFTIFPAGIESEESFEWVIKPVGISTGFKSGTAVFNYGIRIDGFGISSDEEFGQQSVGNITVHGSIFEPHNQFGIPTVSKVTTVPLVSNLVEAQLPEFVSQDHPNFVNFLEAYFEWLEQYRNVEYDIRRLSEYQDIDTSIEIFTEQFFKEFLVNIPRTIMADKALVLKHIKEFYRAKGTEKSYRFFFRILFGLEIDFYFPRTDILRVSDGKWIQPRTIRMISNVGNPGDLIGRKIRGLTNNASAFVENAQVVQESYLTVYELYLNRSSIQGTFLPGEEIKAADAEISGIASPIVYSIDIIDGGAGYEVGQEVIIHNSSGVGAKAYIKSVSPLGEVTKVEVTNFGANYFGTTTVEFPNYVGVTEIAAGEVNIDAITKYPGSYLNQDGQLSATKYIQDGWYYQQFSYVVFVNESIEKYRDALKKLIHPAGLELFGGFRSQEHIDGSVDLPSEYGQVGTTLIRILQQFKRIWAVYDLDDNFIKAFTDKEQAILWAEEFDYPLSKIAEYDSRDIDPDHSDPIDARMTAYSSEIKIIHGFNEAQGTYKLGPSYRSIERDKFFYKPFERRDVNSEMAASANPNYWGTYSMPISGTPIAAYANHQIKDFGHIVIKDMYEKPWTKINIMPEPILKTSDETGIESGEGFGNHEVIKQP